MQTFTLPLVTWEDKTLPGWDEMSDPDRGAALLHVDARDIEGDDYAISDYPCRYLESPLLKALSREQACEHAAKVLEHYDELFEQLGEAEINRLRNLAQARS